MWLMRDSPALFTDLYELMMAQAYFAGGMRGKAYFEVTVRHQPENWGYFVMAGLRELEGYLRWFRFTRDDIEFLKSRKLFTEEFLRHLSTLKADVKVRALPEGTVFFADEPIVEVEGDLIIAQMLESYILNILGFSIITATVAARAVTTAKGVPVVDFGLRRCQGPVASLRAARAGQMAGFAATSNLYAARLLDFACTGTMAHSFVEVCESEEESFRRYGRMYGERAVFLVDTYEPTTGIMRAAKVAGEIYKQSGVKVGGIRIDSGDLVKLSRFARRHFDEEGVPFLKIFLSGDLDEYRIEDLVTKEAEVDGFGIGTRFAVSKYAPSIEIVYKIVQYGDRELFKTSPEKHSRPGRKTIQRSADSVQRTGSKGQRTVYSGDIISAYKEAGDDLLKPFEKAEEMGVIQERLRGELARLPEGVKAIRNPAEYRVDFS
jgi:nicotinate phosphoribosyltransferase